MSSTAGARWLAQQHHEAGAEAPPAQLTTHEPPRASDRWPLEDCMSDRAFGEWARVAAEFGVGEWEASGHDT